jgi:FtsP/CotA-like multicopper oxidase with cupredoxin domain
MPGPTGQLTAAGAGPPPPALTRRALGVTAASFSLARLLLPRAAGAAPPPAPAPAAVREFTLVAREVDLELRPGTNVRAWAYNGTVPGPELRVTEGDLVRITLRNELPAPTSAHWHGIDVPVAMDGVPGLTQQAVPPGGTFVYEFTATNVGTRWYHSHQDAEVQVPLGLFGPVIVEPRAPEPVRYDREQTFVLSEWDLDLTPAVATGDASPPAPRSDVPLSKQLDYDLFLVNGKATASLPPIAVAAGERVRLRLINAGNLIHTIRGRGRPIKVVATDGNPVPPGLALPDAAATLGPSERVDLELLGSDPGPWTFESDVEHQMASGMTAGLR